jgi:hypothetical protein
LGKDDIKRIMLAVDYTNILSILEVGRASVMWILPSHCTHFTRISFFVKTFVQTFFSVCLHGTKDLFVVGIRCEKKKASGCHAQILQKYS